MTAVAQVLRDAADLIEQRGKLYERGTGHPGVYLADVVDERSGPRWTYAAATTALVAHVGTDLLSWGATPGLTTAEVVAALRACADKEEADA